MHALMIPILAVSDAGGFNPLKFDPSAAVLTIATFVVLLLLLAKFGWKPILSLVEEREKRIEDALARSEADRAAAAKLLDDHKRTLAGVQSELAALRETGRAEAEATRRDILAQAEKDSTAVADKARRDIELAKNQALQDIRKEAVNLGLAVAGKVVGRSLDGADQRRIANDVVAGLSTVAGGGR